MCNQLFHDTYISEKWLSPDGTHYLVGTNLMYRLCLNFSFVNIFDQISVTNVQLHSLFRKADLAMLHSYGPKSIVHMSFPRILKMCLHYACGLNFMHSVWSISSSLLFFERYKASPSLARPSHLPREDTALVGLKLIVFTTLLGHHYCSNLSTNHKLEGWQVWAWVGLRCLVWELNPVLWHMSLRL